MRPAFVAAFAAALLFSGGFYAAEPEPAGYRGAPYLAPVPETLAGAHVIGTDAAHALLKSGRVGFIDVLPHAPRPANLPEGTIWRETPHRSIPGAIWLPNTGYDALAPETLAYLLAGLEEATLGDLAGPVVVFCQRDCWMSWNAAKRAAEHGYRRVFWYPEGVDGWVFDDLPLERTTPWEPRAAPAIP